MTHIKDYFVFLAQNSIASQQKGMVAAQKVPKIIENLHHDPPENISEFRAEIERQEEKKSTQELPNLDVGSLLLFCTPFSLTN